MMKEALCALTCLYLCALPLNAQAPASQPQPTPAAGTTRLDDEKICKAQAFHTPAYAYCQDFAILTSGSGDKQEAARHLENLNTDAVELSNAYSIYKLNSVATDDLKATQEAAQKAITASNTLKTQVSSPAVANGSTSLLSKSVATSLLGVAIESGALTQSKTGNTITLQTNPANLFRESFLGTTDLEYLPKNSFFLENFSISAGLATNTSSTVSVPTTGSATSSTVDTTSVLFNSSATKLSSLAVNFEFRNKLTQGFLEKYLKKHDQTHLFLQPAAGSSTALNKARKALGDDFSTYAAASGCQGNDYIALASQSTTVNQRMAQFATMLNGCFATGVATATVKASAEKSDLDTDESNYVQALQADIARFQQNMKKQISGWDASAQYVYNKPVGQPETHDFRFVGTGDLSKGGVSTWTLNAAVSIYGSVPSGAQYDRFKDAQFSGELDRSLGSSSSSPSFSLAGYGQYQSKATVLNITSSSVPSGVTLPANAQVFLSGTKGWLGVVQAKITVHVGGAQIPVAAKWSNRTDLLDKSKLGAQFGVSYDFSQLKQLIGMGAK